MLGRLLTEADDILKAGLDEKGHEFFQSLQNKKQLENASSWCVLGGTDARRGEGGRSNKLLSLPTVCLITFSCMGFS